MKGVVWHGVVAVLIFWDLRFTDSTVNNMLMCMVEWR
jgi:hypothetical protein